MSIWGKAKAKVEELYGRAEELYGETHGDAAAEVRGEAHVVEADEHVILARSACVDDEVEVERVTDHRCGSDHLVRQG